MSENSESAFEVWKSAVGESGVGEWMTIDQDRINQFADVTEDHQFIHVDPDAAKASPFGTTIAHGFLTLSMLSHLDMSVPRAQDARYNGIVMGINYGFEKVRFVSPVKVGGKIRARAELADVVLKGDAVQTTRTMTVEIEGEERPALVADWITRVIYG
jgi:acyl dehydratase